jgi:c(7)-type cytochrome triheme protein
MHVFQRLPRVRQLGAVAVLGALVLGSLYLARASGAQAAFSRPISFDHKSMMDAGMTCLFCHTGATRSAAAGIPSVESCMGCHNLIEIDSPEIMALHEYWARQEPVHWARVNRLPRFVYFSHRVHVATAGLNCERCHGDVGQMAEARPVVDMNMGWCLGCHEQQPNASQLRDCIVCHQ